MARLTDINVSMVRTARLHRKLGLQDKALDSLRAVRRTSFQSISSRHRSQHRASTWELRLSPPSSQKPVNSELALITLSLSTREKWGRV